jgi:AbiV family abortive infection protein
LNDAVTLYTNKAYSSAIVLAAFAREELGRSHILRELRKKVMSGEEIAVKRILKECGNHVNKQEWSQFSVIMHAPHDSERGRLMLAMLHDPPRGVEELFEKLSSMAGQVKVGERRYKLRNSLLYVDPDKSGTHWIRPRSLSPVSTQRFISQALLDYFYYYDHIERVYPDDSDGFFNDIRRWSDRPQLHSPVELSNQLFG